MNLYQSSDEVDPFFFILLDLPTFRGLEDPTYDSKNWTLNSKNTIRVTQKINKERCKQYGGVIISRSLFVLFILDIYVSLFKESSLTECNNVSDFSEFWRFTRLSCLCVPYQLQRQVQFYDIPTSGPYSFEPDGIIL